MQISVNGSGLDGNQQTRAYVEYRVFSALAGSSHAVAVAHVSLASPAAGDPLLCLIEVHLHSGDVLRARGRAFHPYRAVECAAQRMKHALARQGRRARAS